MKIDIEPVIEKANELDRICMDMRGIDALYVIRYANGKDCTVKWSRAEIATFVPNSTVSEMIERWEQGTIDRYNEICKTLETGLHPTWTKSVPVLDSRGNKTGRYNTVPESIDTYHQRSGWERQKSQVAEQFGKLTFVKIV